MKDTYRLKVKGSKKIFPVHGNNQTSKQSWVLMLILDKINFKTVAITRDNEWPRNSTFGYIPMYYLRLCWKLRLLPGKLYICKTLNVFLGRIRHIKLFHYLEASVSSPASHFPWYRIVIAILFLRALFSIIL